MVWWLVCSPRGQQIVGSSSSLVKSKTMKLVFFCLSPKLAPLKGKSKYGLSYINYTYSSTRYCHFERTNIQARFCPIGLEAIARITDRAFCDRILLSSILYSRYLFWIKQMHKKPFSFLCLVYALFVGFVVCLVMCLVPNVVSSGVRCLFCNVSCAQCSQ